MAKYLMINPETLQHSQPERKQKGVSHGALEGDYFLPLRHVAISGLFAFLGSKWMWITGGLIIPTLAVMTKSEPELVKPFLLLLLVPPAIGIRSAFQKAAQEWDDFTDRVKRSRWLLEEELGKDLNGDGHIGEPPILVNARQGKKETDNPHLDEFRNWVQSLAIKGTAERDHLTVVKPKQYKRWRDALSTPVTPSGWIPAITS